MDKVLIDYNKQQMKLGEIIKREKVLMGEVDYFLLGDREKGKLVLYKYDKAGNVDYKMNINNIYFDEGVNIINDETCKWTIVGPKDECYYKIFKN